MPKFPKFPLMPWARRRLEREAEDARLIALAEEIKRKDVERIHLANKHRAEHVRKHVNSALTAQEAVKQREAQWVQPDDPGPKFVPLDPLIDPGYQFTKEAE